ncbi:hypothetical protein AB3M83_06045 [Microbacterium sp. 179-B 1A2 NHS]|uniref:hypothetical protein n=1 Tax=Microbacterium sp. 179-B 1A2 NHS TaxID=3142383 RepID=UPI0039A37AF7
MSASSPVPAPTTPIGVRLAGGRRRIPRITPLVVGFAAVNTVTIVLSLIGWSSGLNRLQFMFPQASVFFESGWGPYYGFASVWFLVMGLAVVITAIGALVAPSGHRPVGAFRAMTFFGFGVGCFFGAGGFILTIGA